MTDTHELDAERDEILLRGYRATVLQQDSEIKRLEERSNWYEKEHLKTVTAWKQCQKENAELREDLKNSHALASFAVADLQKENAELRKSAPWLGQVREQDLQSKLNVAVAKLREFDTMFANLLTISDKREIKFLPSGIAECRTSIAEALSAIGKGEK